MVDSINGINSGKVDLTRWKKLTPQEIIKEKSKGEDIPAEMVAWAQQMAAFSKIPDNVTYEQVDGDVGLDALEKLGIEDEENSRLEAENAQKAVETEDPDAVRDPNKAEEIEEQDLEVSMPKSETANEAEKEEQAEFSLADTTITADNDEIRKRKERKGIL